MDFNVFFSYCWKTLAVFIHIVNIYDLVDVLFILMLYIIFITVIIIIIIKVLLRMYVTVKPVTRKILQFKFNV